MSHIINFAILKTIIDIEGVLINITPLHIGKGGGKLGEIDLPIEKDISRIPYIPGSSIKGGIRALSEAIARASNYNVCDPLDPKNICIVSTEAIKRIMDLRAKGRGLGEIKNEVVSIYKVKGYDNIATDIENKSFSTADELMSYILNSYGPCIICRVFGNAELSSHVIFFDAYPVKKDASPFSRTRVALDRFRGASRTGALFTYEYIPKGYEWSFKIRIINLDLIEGEGQEVQLLRSLIKYLCLHGVQIGGMKTIGYGILKIDPNKTNIRRCIIKDLELKCTSYSLSEVISKW